MLKSGLGLSMVVFKPMVSAWFRRNPLVNCHVPFWSPVIIEVPRAVAGMVNIKTSPNVVIVLSWAFSIVLNSIASNNNRVLI